jgi:GNAT superfamily N-acetyltransferase
MSADDMAADGRTIRVRFYNPSDAEQLVEILKLNGQYDYPHVEDPEAMNRVAACDAAVALVAEVDSRVVGYAKAVYDGSRALIHLLSVHPEYQGTGVGSDLVSAVEQELKERGAPTTAVTVTEDSEGYWLKKGYKRMPIFLMLKIFDDH